MDAMNDRSGDVDRRGALKLLGGAAAFALFPTLTGCDARDLRSVNLGTPQSERVIGQGGWCWFHSPRAAIGGGKVWLGSVVSGGHERDGDVEVIAFDTKTLRVAERHVVGRTRPDDHAAPSVMMLSSGRPQVAWSTHTRTNWIEVGDVGRPLQRIQRPAALVEPGRGVSYASAHVVGGKRWLLYRGEKFSWNLLVSSDGGRTWAYRGLVVDTAGGQRPYIIAASDGTQLHVMASDGNPTEYRGTSVSYFTVAGDFTIRDNLGARIGAVGSRPVQLASATRMFTGRAGSTELADTDAWVCDVQFIARRPTAILSVRDPWPPGSAKVGQVRHRYLWARQRGDGSWTVEHMAWAGGELYGNQPDYSGLGSLDPTNAQRVVISTNVNPHSGAPLRSTRDNKVHYELWEGYRAAERAWTWVPLTRNSAEDNIRPILVAGEERKVLVWMCGTYRSWLDYDTRIVARTF
jgi:hypothetical protein